MTDDRERWALILGLIIASALLLQEPVVDAINRFLGGN